MLLGGGLTIGRKHSIAIDIGAIGGFVDIVSGNADYTREYTETPEVMINEFQLKPFGSIGYTFRL